MSSTEARGRVSPDVCMVGHTPTRLWGLSSEERLRRLCARVGVTRVVDETAPPPEGGRVFVRADYLYDERVLRELVEKPGILLRLPDGAPAGAHAPAGQAAETLDWIRGSGPAPDGFDEHTPATLTAAFVKGLRKVEPPVVLPIDAGRRDEIERYLFDGAYKGVTDFVTKWVWPRPARAVTAVCTRLGIRPNHVTLVGASLAVVAAVLFGSGDYAIGLGLAWVMTFLDTVDGKLARVTVTSSTFGHYLDHGIDIVHPPIWYVAWGMGLAEWPASLPSLTAIYVAIVVAYVVGRLVEGAFSKFLGRFSIFCWRPLDSWFRLIVARRNPNLVLLTGGWAVGRPDVGLLAVAAWTVVCTVLLLLRLFWSIVHRVRFGNLETWLAEVPAEGELPSFARPFVHRAPIPGQPTG